MPTADALLRELSENRGLLTEIAQLQAHALLNELTDEPPAIRWTYIPARVVRNSILARVQLEELAGRVTDGLDTFSDFAKTLGLTWEALAKLGEGPARETALVNAALNFELAGYQANAALLARRVISPTQRVPTVASLASLLLQRRLFLLRDLVTRATAEPDAAAMNESDLLEVLATAVAARGLDFFAKYLLAGESAFVEAAVAQLARAEYAFSKYGLMSEANLVRSLRHLLPVIVRHSIWTNLASAGQGSPRWGRYLKLLARGVSSDIFRGRSVSELWPSQLTSLKHGLFETNKSKVVRMPTSAGKTRIAEMAIVHTLVTTPGSKCVYVAPYRALVAELEHGFMNLMADLGYRTSQMVGSYETDDFEREVIRDADLIVVTPEKLDLIVRSEPDNLRHVALYVLDEIQVLDAGRRGVKFELLLARLLQTFPSARFIVTSAVVPQLTLEDFARWFRASTNDIIAESWRPSIQRYAKFRWSGDSGEIEYARGDVAAIPRAFVRGIIRRRPYEYINPETGRWKRRLFPDPGHRAQVAAELAFKLSSVGSVLVFCAQTNFVDSVAAALLDRVGLARLTGEPIPPHFEHSPNSRSTLLAREWLGDRPITSWLTSGIGVHYGLLPDALRTAVESDVRERRLNVLIATNTLAQGVNLPFRSVVIHSSSRYGDDGRNRISARDYWNIAGRAGRAGEETDGLVVHLTLGPRDEEDFQYYLAHRTDVEPVASALLQQCIALAQQRISDEAVQAEIDPEILPLLLEEGDIRPTDAIDGIFERTLAQIQSARQGVDTRRFRRVLATRAEKILQEVPSVSVRRVYSSTGLTTSSCLSLTQHIRDNEAEVRHFLISGQPGDIESAIVLLLPALLGLSECRPAREFGGSYNDLLVRWLQGTELLDIIGEFAAEPGSSEQIGRLIDDLFRYKLPWGVAAYVRIAQEELEIDRTTMTTTPRYLSAMIKYGVPDPASCWAMSAGIPFRRTAMQIASAYVAEATEMRPADFREWLGGLSSERIQAEFNLRSPLLEDVARRIPLVGSNVMATVDDIDDLLPIDVMAEGVQYGNRAAAARLARPGDIVDVRRDYDNAADRNAIALYLNDREIGYLPRQVGQVLAPEIDTGREIAASVLTVQLQTIPRIRIRLN